MKLHESRYFYFLHSYISNIQNVCWINEWNHEARAVICFSLSYLLISLLIISFGHWIDHCTYHIFLVLSLKQEFSLCQICVFVRVCVHCSHICNNKYKLNHIKMKVKNSSHNFTIEHSNGFSNWSKWVILLALAIW